MRRGNMKAERTRLGMTIDDVASYVGVHKNAISRWENGQAEPFSSNLIKLCELYGCSAEYLLEQTDDPKGKVIANS